MEQKKKRNYGKMTAEELSAAVNLVKSENSGVFGVKDIRSAFKDLGVPMYSEFATTLVQQGVLVQAGLTYQDGFSWSSTEPIHINKVVELMTITRKKVAAQARKYNQKKKAVQQGTWVEQPKETTEIEQVLEEVPVHEHKELVPVDKAINKAIKLLTENGYRVSKPVLRQYVGINVGYTLKRVDVETTFPGMPHHSRYCGAVSGTSKLINITIIG